MIRDMSPVSYRATRTSSSTSDTRDVITDVTGVSAVTSQLLLLLARQRRTCDVLLDV